MNQTNNRIRDEWREKLNKILWDNIDSDVINCERPMKKQLAPDLENFIDELLKSQRAELVEKIQEYKMYYNPIGDDINKGRRLACDDIISIIK